MSDAYAADWVRHVASISTVIGSPRRFVVDGQQWVVRGTRHGWGARAVPGLYVRLRHPARQAVANHPRSRHSTGRAKDTFAADAAGLAGGGGAWSDGGRDHGLRVDLVECPSA